MDVQQIGAHTDMTRDVSRRLEPSRPIMPMTGVHLRECCLDSYFRLRCMVCMQPVVFCFVYPVRSRLHATNAVCMPNNDASGIGKLVYRTPFLMHVTVLTYGVVGFFPGHEGLDRQSIVCSSAPSVY